MRHFLLLVLVITWFFTISGCSGGGDSVSDDNNKTDGDSSSVDGDTESETELEDEVEVEAEPEVEKEEEKTNNPPIADSKNAAIEEDQTINITLTGKDAEDDELTFIVTTDPEHGKLTGTSPKLTYTPDENFNGVDSFKYKANDGELDSTEVSVIIAISPVNDAPEATVQEVSTDEEVELDIVLAGTDVENSGLLFEIVEQPKHGTLTGDAPKVKYAPEKDYNGTDAFSFKVNDGLNDSAAAVVTITINPVDDPPKAIANSLTTEEDTELSITLEGSDIDKDPLTYIVVDNPINGKLSGTDKDLKYMPNENYSGSDSFTFKVNDGNSDSEKATIDIEVTAVNDSPVADTISKTTDEEVPVAIDLTGSDTENDSLTFTIAADPTNGTISGTAPNVTYTPNKDFVGNDSFAYKANDGNSDSAPATVSITVNQVNDPPVATAQNLETDEETALNITLSGTDIDTTELTFAKVTDPAHGTLTGTAPELVYTPEKDYFGSDEFTFKANDGEYDSDPATIMITVKSTNDDPEAKDDTATANANIDLEISVLDNDIDVDQDELSIASVDATSTEGGTLAILNLKKIKYTPPKDYLGEDSFNYTVTDGKRGTSSAKVTVTVEDKISPEIVITSPASGTYNFGTAITIGGEIRDNLAVTVLKYSLVGDSQVHDVSSGIMGEHFSFDVNLPNGTHEVAVTAYDSSGNGMEYRIILGNCNGGAGVHTWKGGDATSPNDFDVAENWSPATVPGTGTDIFICSLVENQPELSSDTELRNIHVEKNAILSATSPVQITVSGNINGGGKLQGGGSFLVDLTGTDNTIEGLLDCLLNVKGNYKLSADSYAIGITIFSGFSLDINSHKLNHNGSMQIYDDGLIMNDPADEVHIASFVKFSSETLSLNQNLNAGTIYLAGNFTQERKSSGVSKSSFAPAGTTVVFNSTDKQNVSFETPGDTFSYFKDVRIVDGAEVSLNSDVYIHGKLTMEGSAKLNQLGGFKTYFTSNLPHTNENYKVENTYVHGDITMDEDVVIPSGSNHLFVEETKSLTLNGFTLSVGGNLEVNVSTMSDGLKMTNEDDELIVEKTAIFTSTASNVSNTNFTEGIIRSRGDFQQKSTGSTASRESFVSTGTKVIFDGDTAQGDQVCYFTWPGADMSHFHDVEVTTSAKVEPRAQTYLTGSLEISGYLWLGTGYQMTIEGDLILEDGSNLDNNGTILYGGTFTDNGSTLTGAGTIEKL